MKSKTFIKLLRKRFSRGFAVSAQQHTDGFWVVFHARGTKTINQRKSESLWEKCTDEDDCLSYFQAILNQQD